MSLVSLVILSGVGALLFFTNPGHNRLHEVLAPVFLQHVHDLSKRPASQEDGWTFLPAVLGCGSYCLFHTTRFPGEAVTRGTPAEGLLTFGALCSAFVLFWKSPATNL